MGTTAYSFRPPRASASVRVASWIFALILLGSAASCATRQSSLFDEGAGTVRIDVLNLNWSDATLWVHRSGARLRLGRVAGKGEGSFEIEWPASLEMQIEIDLLAGDRCFTETLSVDPGEAIYLELVENMRLEFACR